MPRRPSDPDKVLTTVALPRGLLHEAKVRAATDATTLQALVTEGLQLALNQRNDTERRQRARKATTRRT